MNFAFLLSALLHLFGGGALPIDGAKVAPPPDTSGVLTGARAQPMDTSGVLTGARAVPMDTSGVLTGIKAKPIAHPAAPARAKAMDTSGVITG